MRILIVLLLLCSPVMAQEHTHEGAVGKFYQSWMRPDAPNLSCCHKLDCAPAASRFIDGKWEAQRDGNWVRIPPNRIEARRDSPDGRSHLCGRKGAMGEFSVFCFIPGNGA